MKKILSLFIVLVLFLGMCPGTTALSGAFLVMDGRTTVVLESENGDSVLPMASTTKVMTALVVLETTDLSDIVTIPAAAAGIEGSSLYIKAGENYTVEELLYGLMLRSANDWAVALAIHVGGSEEGFVEMMNQRAQVLGLRDTHFSNPNGLSAEGHYTTAKELALIMVEAMKNETFRRITGSKRYTVKDQVIANHNKLLTLYEACIGGKTGYTMKAGRCLVTVAQQDGAPLVCVTLGRRDDWNIHISAYEKWFALLENITLAEQASYSTELTIAGGGTVRASNCNKVTANLFAYDGAIDVRVKAPGFIYGNKAVGDVVGTVEYWYHDVKVSESPLVLEQAITVEVRKELFITRIFRFFRRLFLKNA